MESLRSLFTGSQGDDEYAWDKDSHSFTPSTPIAASRSLSAASSTSGGSRDSSG